MSELSYWTPVENRDFESKYLSIRALEGWIYSDEELSKLPHVSSSDQHAGIWWIRLATANDFAKYVTKSEKKSVLEVGSGNGWFSVFLQRKTGVEVVGIDINEFELQQAVRVFGNEPVEFAYADIFNAQPHRKFDLIVLNGSIQYFSDPLYLRSILRTWLTPGGEIHIIDSPIHSSKTKATEAKARTRQYYNKLGADFMNQYFFHHTFNDLENFKVLRPVLMDHILSLFGRKRSPFPWLMSK